MKQRIVDNILALWMLYSAFSALSVIRVFDFPVLGMFVSIFYVTAAFGLFRSLPWVKYLIYVNALVTVVFGSILLAKIGSAILLNITVSVSLVIFSSIYCYYRFKEYTVSTSLKKEAGILTLFLVLFFGVIFVADYFVGPSIKTLSGPIELRQ